MHPTGYRGGLKVSLISLFLIYQIQEMKQEFPKNGLTKNLSLTMKEKSILSLTLYLAHIYITAARSCIKVLQSQHQLWQKNVKWK